MYDIKIEDLDRRAYRTIIDVRAPIEFAEGAIPHAINIPLLTNIERETVGKMYKQEGERQAKWLAMKIVSPKIPDILQKIKEVSTEHEAPLIYCWRGGMRSKVVATLCTYAGVQTNRLIDGYKGYRKYILERIPQMIPERAIVIHGGTGVGKTEILHELKLKGYPVLDLEKIANHRGSIFGSIGQGDPNNQKTFDALLYEQLKAIQNEGYFFIESESRRIGKVIQPEQLLNESIRGKQLHIHVSLPIRIERILTEYTTPYVGQDWYVPKVMEAFSHIEKRIKNRETAHKITNAITEQQFSQVIELLLTEYYDPRYNHSNQMFEGEFHPIDGENVKAAVIQIESFVEKGLEST